ncbi:hypothetical protein M9458_002507, partial [Cirrhinus mrigala]
IDFVTDLPNSEGHTCILVAVNRFLKACWLILLKSLPTALETAQFLFNRVFRNYGIPEEIVSDRGPQFISHVWKAFFHLLGVTVSLSSGYHPQTNGQTQRKIQELRRYLRASPGPSMHRILSDRTPRDSHHSSAFSVTSPHSSRGQKSLRRFQLKRVWDSAHVHLQCAVRRHKTHADAWHSSTPTYHPGDKVRLSTQDLRLRLPCKKLRQINKVTYQLQLPPRYRIHPTFEVSLLKPCFPSAPDEPSPPEVIDQPSVYQVRDILGSRRRDGWPEYLIDLEGYGPEERSSVARCTPSFLSNDLSNACNKKHNPSTNS